MLQLFYVLTAVYLAAVNVYSFLLVKNMKKQAELRGEPKFGNAKIFVAGILGGAITAYLMLFILKFRTDDLLLMLTLPLFSVINVFMIIVLFRGAFPLFTA